MRPILVDFKEDGSVDIDKSVYALYELSELARLYGRGAVEVLVRLYAYRTPVNPFAPKEERFERAVADTTRRYKSGKVDPKCFGSPVWEAAVKRFMVERYDPLWESFDAYEAKCHEFTVAISDTPVREVIEQESKPKGRRKKSDAVSDSDGEVKTFSRTVDNTEMLQKMNKALTEYRKSYEETRTVLFRVKKGNSSLPQVAEDFRNRR